MSNNLIYQFYTGNIPYYAKVSNKLFKEYAKRIDADYICDFNKPFVNIGNSQYHNCFRPIMDQSLDNYDNILFCDMDVFPVNNATDNIFDLSIENIGIVEETQTPAIRYVNVNANTSKRTEERWGNLVEKYYPGQLLRDEEDRLRVFNSGVVVYTREGIKLARSTWDNIDSYQSRITNLPRFYMLDQNYIGAMLSFTPFTILDRKWNSQIHYIGDKDKKPRDIYDSRSADTVFVHNQMRGRDKLNDDMIYDIVNKPVSDWRHT